METIKISQLRESTSFKDLYTIGTDENNESVKISLEGIDSHATEALDMANEAISTATDAKESAEQAVKDAQEAIDNAQEATDKATEAAEKADEAADKATEAAEQAEEVIHTLIPEAMELTYPASIVESSTMEHKVEATLLPDGVMQNVIFMCDHTSLDVGLQGQITILGLGVTRIRVIPTCNTSLAQEIAIEVLESQSLRLVTANSLRFTQSGVLRFNGGR